MKLLIHFLIFILSHGVYAQPGKAEAGIIAIMKEIKVMGLSVAVVKNNRIIYSNSFGLKDLATNKPLTDDCIFRIASISKSFSATAIMRLVEAKKTFTG